MDIDPGGEHEYNKRAGTENIIGIGGLRSAITERSKKLDSITEKLQTLRDVFENGVLKSIDGVSINGNTE